MPDHDHVEQPVIGDSAAWLKLALLPASRKYPEAILWLSLQLDP